MSLLDLLLRLVDLVGWGLNVAGTAAEIGTAGVRSARWLRSKKPLPPMPDPEALLERAKARWREQAAAQAKDFQKHSGLTR
jgi:hypothetical protein